ncbi:MAG: TolB protein [Mariprofundales bacterium]
MIKRILIGVVLALPLNAEAGDLLDWATSRVAHHEQSQIRDGASLLTLEPGQNELYPQVGGAREFFATVIARKQLSVSRRALENGDPLNTVVEDALPDSVRWQDGNLRFLSAQIGGLGLWQKPASGQGLVKRLRQFSGRVVQPTMLPDGDIVAVRLATRSIGSDRERGRDHRFDPFDNWSQQGDVPYIVRIEKDGEEQRLGDGVNPAISPDGQSIVFSMGVGRSRHLFLMGSDGSGLAQLTDARSVDVQPAWSADGQWIAFTSNRARADMRHRSRSNWDVWLVRRDGTDLMRLTTDPARDGAPVFTPDGRSVLFHSERKVSKAILAEHQLRHAEKGFHIWRLMLPSLAAAKDATAPHLSE